MKQDTESFLAVAAVGAIAIAAAAAMVVPRTAFADDITIDTTPFVSTRTRVDVRQELLGQVRQVRIAATEWSQQQGERSTFKGQFASPEVRADFVAHRQEVSALTGEDSGSSYFKMKPLAAGGASVMGGPRQ